MTDATPPASPPPGSAARRPGLAYALVVFLLALAGWNAFATSVGDAATGRWITDDRLWADGSEGAELARLLDELPAPSERRVVVLGSSQMKVVQGEPGARTAATGGQLARRLGPGWEVLDLSAGGQQTLESLVVLHALFERTRPDSVVLGVGGFSMRRDDVREELKSQPRDLGALRSWTAGSEPLASVFSAFGSAADDGEARAATVQEQIDDGIAAALGRVPAIAHRSTLYDRVIDTPLRRDLMGWITRHLTSRKTARAYPLSSKYPISLAAVRSMAARCAAAEVPFHVVALPFDGVREPIVYDEADVARISADLAAIEGVHFVDLTKLLGPEHFGDYVDGSRDALHYDRAGHELVAEALAPRIRTFHGPPGSRAETGE